MALWRFGVFGFLDFWASGFVTFRRLGVRSVFEYQVCPRGPTNAPAMFQHFMNDILREHVDMTTFDILDDVIIYSKDPTHHV